MSFDIQLSGGDIQLDTAGNLVKVTDTNKLVQDIMKVLYTTLGSDPFNSFYGSILTDDAIGTTIIPDMLEARAREAIYNSLEILKQSQAEQKLYQELTQAEILVDVAELNIAQDGNDPRQYNVELTVLSGELTTITLEFNFSI